MNKMKKELAVQNVTLIDESQLFEHVVEIIEGRKSRAAAHINQETTLMLWEVGRFVNSVILDFNVPHMGKRFCRS